jgi:single-strand DNA-binding protein
MSVNATVVTVVGRVVSNLTTHVIPSGAKVTNFRIACQERMYDKAQEQWVDGNRTYMKVACWRNLAENVADSLRQGDQVVIKGRLKLVNFQSKEGDQRTDVEIDAWAIGPDLTFHTVSVNRPDWSVPPRQETLIDPPLDAPEAELPQAA